MACTLLAGGLLCLSVGCRVKRHEPRDLKVVVQPVRPLVFDRKKTEPTDGGGYATLADAGPPPKGSSLLVVGGVDSQGLSPSTEALAIAEGTRMLQQGESALEAAIASVAALEDSGERNAGLGAHPRLDGSIEMDAAVMTSDGSFAAVTAVRGLKNPVRVASKLLGRSERVLAGEGARRFARAIGATFVEAQPSRVRGIYENALSQRARSDAGMPDGYEHYVDRSRWPDLVDAGAIADAAVAVVDAGDAGDQDKPVAAEADTVAALVRVKGKGYAVAASSGGPILALPGRVGDVPTPGAALWVGERGAVFVSGPGDVLLERSLAFRTYERLRATQSARTAARWGVAQGPKGKVVVAVMDARSSVVEPEDGSAWARYDKTLKTSDQGKIP